VLDKIKARLKAYNQAPLSNSMGLVTRNYSQAPSFQPEYQVQGITYKAIDKIGLSMSVYEPIVKRPNAGEPIPNHPLYNLFQNPNPLCNNPSDFVHLLAMLYEIYGENFIYMVRGENTNKIKELYLLPPDKIELKFYEGELIGYVLHKSNGQQVPFGLDEIYHDKRPNPFNEWRGMSVLEKAAVYVDTEINTANFTLNYIKNSGSPSGIVSLPAMEKEAFKQFAAQWREHYEGPQNAGKTAFIRGEEAKFQAVGATLKDIDQKVTRDMSKEDVLMMLEVPKELLGWTKDAGLGRNTFEAANFVFAENKLEPMMRRLDRIYEFIAKDLNKGQPIDVTHESPVPEDKDYKLKRLETGVNVWITVNEARAEDGLEALTDPEADKLHPTNTINPAPKVEPAKSLKIIKKVAPTKSEMAKKINGEQEEFRSKLVKTNDIYAKQFKSKLTTFVSDQEDKVIANINASAKTYEEWLYSVKDESEAAATVLTPVIIDLMEAQSDDVANFITGELLTISPEMRATVEQNIKQISGVFNADTLKALEQTLSEGQTQGESLAKLKKRVESVYSDAKGYRAERIARTETLKASNKTAEQVYNQNGYSRVEWFINPGACEFCQTYAGRTKSIGSVFTNIGDVITGTDGNQLRIEYDDIGTPPLHPNCTCSLIPVD
jgi:HK97 family phage portal protein